MTVLKKVVKLKTVISSSAGLAMATSCYLAGLQVAIITVGELEMKGDLVGDELPPVPTCCEQDR